MINIAVILKPNYTALEHYRQTTPHTFMCEISDDLRVTYLQTPDGSIDSIPDAELRDFQLIQFIRHIDMKGKTKEAVDRCHSLGFKVVFDIDDYWNADKDHTLSKQMKANNYERTCIEAFTYADWVTTTTPFFADEIRPYSKNITVLPNCISPLDEQFKPAPIDNTRIRFGWVGGVFHLPDVALLSSATKRIFSSFNGISCDNLQLCLAGFNPSEEYIQMEKILTSGWSSLRRLDPEYYNYLSACTPALEHLGYDKPYRRIWTKDIHSYGQVYNEIDVALVPLRDTKFNNCKSELKIIEAGTMGKAVICSNVMPYQEYIVDGENGLLATNWYDEIKYILNEPGHREEMGLALMETIKTHFNPEKIQRERAELYRTLCA